MLRVSIAVVACVVGFSTAGFAQNQRGAMREACKADVEKYCSDVQRGWRSYRRVSQQATRSAQRSLPEDT